MTLPALKASEWLAALGMDMSVSEFKLRQIIRDARAELDRSKGGETWMFHTVLGVAHWRLREPEKALEHAQLAARADPQNVIHCNQIGAALMELDRSDEALGVLLAGLKLPAADNSAVILFGNLAEAFFRSGDAASASECMEKAIQNARPNSQRDQVAIANQLAELGESSRALEYVARYLTLVRGATVTMTEASRCELSAHEESVLRAHPGSARLIRDLRKFGFRDQTVNFQPERDGNDGASLLSEMGPSIGRANLAVLG